MAALIGNPSPTPATEEVCVVGSIASEPLPFPDSVSNSDEATPIMTLRDKVLAIYLVLA